MILRGYTKNLIVVKNLENPLIDEAFLILKKEAREEATEEDIVREANMLISGFDIRAKKKAPLGGAVWCLLGSLIIVGPVVFTAKLCNAMNLLCADYNVKG